jgi:Mrp family chromosome partitioning ATPase
LTDQVAEVLQTLRQSYDHIIVDGPAVLLAPEARLFARHADAILYSVRWSKTPLQVVIRGLEALEDNGSAATGLVLTKVNLRKMRKLSTDPCIGAIRTAQAI